MVPMADQQYCDDDKPGDDTFAPVSNLPLENYKGLPEKMGKKCSKHLKIRKDGTMVLTA